eukprot:6922317-Pyramimonas_sp.AAC.1
MARWGPEVGVVGFAFSHPRFELQNSSPGCPSLISPSSLSGSRPPMVPEVCINKMSIELLWCWSREATEGALHTLVRHSLRIPGTKICHASLMLECCC